jgi:8-oxo-dGTP diphosphatase
MKILTEIYRTEGLDVSGKTIHRTAVRAVILRGLKLFMVYSANVGDYKFPGGGVDACETHEHALARELLEECGATLLRVDESLGAIIEYDVAKEPEYDLFKMSSYYYFCQIGDAFGAQILDDYEHDLGFQPAWIDIKDAIEKNRLLLDTKNPPQWLRREIFALEYIQRRIM